MLTKADRLRLKKLFSKAILRLCKSNLRHNSEFQIEAMIGITFGDSDVALISINEMVTGDGEAKSQICDTDRDLVAEEFDYQEPGSKSFGTAEGHHIGNESYGDDVDAENSEMRCAGGETFGPDAATAREDVENGVGSGLTGQHLYDDKMVDDSEHKRTGARIAGSRKRKKSFTAGSEQFSKKEFDREAEDLVAVKGEPGINEYGSRLVKPRSPSQKVLNPDADFLSCGVDSKNQFSSWPRKKKSVGLQCGRKVPGSKEKGAMIAAPTAPSALQSPADQRQYLDELCRGLVQDSIAQNQFSCHLCNVKLSSKGALATHIKGSHIDAKLYPCDQCDQRFKWPMQLHRHRNSCHCAA